VQGTVGDGPHGALAVLDDVGHLVETRVAWNRHLAPIRQLAHAGPVETHPEAAVGRHAERRYRAVRQEVVAQLVPGGESRAVEPEIARIGTQPQVPIPVLGQG
jgi:hypothetical protein